MFFFEKVDKFNVVIFKVNRFFMLCLVLVICCNVLSVEFDYILFIFDKCWKWNVDFICILCFLCMIWFLY